MSETEHNTQGQKPKFSRLAMWSLLLSVFGACLLVLILYGFGIYNFIGQSYLPFYLRPLYVYGHLVSGLIAITGIIAGIVAIKKVRNKRGILKGRAVAISGVVISMVLLFVWIWHSPNSPFTARKRCAANLRSLARAALVYTTGDYAMPTDNWCDLLIEGRRKHVESEKQFRCPADEKGPCSYAITTNRKLRSPSNMVLFFETKGGWNQFGVPEILNTENHKEKGCNVVFLDGHVEFVKKEQLGNLNWGNK